MTLSKSPTASPVLAPIKGRPLSMPPYKPTNSKRRTSNTESSNLPHTKGFWLLYCGFYHEVRLESNTDDNRNDYRSFHGALQEEAGDGFGEVVAGDVEVCGARIAHRSLHRFADDEARLVHQLFVVAQIDESAGDDVGRFV